MRYSTLEVHEPPRKRLNKIELEKVSKLRYLCSTVSDGGKPQFERGDENNWSLKLEKHRFIH